MARALVPLTPHLRSRRVLAGVLSALALVVPTGGSPALGVRQLALSAASEAWAWPLDPPDRVVRGFEPPRSPYGPGHRGVDLAGAVGQRVLAIGSGRVSFAGSVAGRGVVVVDHGRLSSTYQPVSPFVTKGDRVRAGQPVGVLQGVYSHCAPDACLHLGLKRGDVYLDPLRLLPDLPIRLKPLRGLSDRRAPIRGRRTADGSATVVGRLAGRAGARTGLVGGARSPPAGTASQVKREGVLAGTQPATGPS